MHQSQLPFFSTHGYLNSAAGRFCVEGGLMVALRPVHANWQIGQKKNRFAGTKACTRDQVVVRGLDR